MSNIYHTEPITSGKVVVHTTFGDIDIELWPKEAPLACRNFIQLALEGYYDNTVVHRVIKNFMVQMGDPTGTGMGGESIWGKPFKDEIHGRIKFNHRGQVAMANASKPNSNQSQFFITLDSCDWLHGKHTIFGKVTGSTFYNVVRIGEIDTGESDRPVDEIRITSVEVLMNPFEDIVPRIIVKEDKKEVVVEKKGKEITAVAVKNNKLLSFGDDEEEEESQVRFKMKSLHDSKKRKLADTLPISETKRVENEVAHKKEAAVAASSGDAGGKNSRSVNQADDDEEEEKTRITPKNRQQAGSSAKSDVKSTAIAAKNNNSDEDDDDDDLLDEEAMARKMKRARREERTKAKSNEFMQLREELMRSRRAVNVLTGVEAAEVQKQTAVQEMLTPLEQRRQKYMQRKATHGHREESTLDKLDQFKKLLKTTKPADTVREKKESYHGQLLEKNSDDEQDEALDDWCAGKLKFKKHIDDQYRQGGANLRVEDYEVIDPKLQRLKTHQ